MGPLVVVQVGVLEISVTFSTSPWYSVEWFMERLLLLLHRIAGR